MKSRNIFIPITLIAALVFTCTPANSAGAYINEDKAQQLNNLGLYSGINPLQFEPDLGASMERQSGISMIVKLFGMEGAALALSEEQIDAILAQFPDADRVSSWARPYLALAAQQGILTGLPDGSISPLAPFNGQSLSTQILRMLGYHPDYHQSLQMGATLGALSPEDALRLMNNPLLKDDLVGIAFGSLNLRTNAGTGMTLLEQLRQAGVLQAAKWKCPAADDAVVGEQDYFTITSLPSGSLVTQQCDKPAVVEIKQIETGPTGTNIVYMPLSIGTAKVTLTITEPGSVPVQQVVVITVKKRAFISGPDYPVLKSTGPQTVAIQVFPADALVQAECSDPSFLSSLSIGESGENRELAFTALKAGDCKIRLTVQKEGYTPASTEILISVVSKIQLTGLEDSYDLGTGLQELDFKVNPSDTQIEVETDDSTLITSLAATGSGTDRLLTFSTHGTGACTITLTATREGYNPVIKNITVNTVDTSVSGAPSPPQITISGLENTKVIVEKNVYIPFTTNSPDVEFTLSVDLLDGESDITLASPAVITFGNTHFLVFNAGSQGVEQVTITASRSGWNSGARTVDITIVDSDVAEAAIAGLDPGYNINIASMPETKAFTVSGPTVQVTAYYKNTNPPLLPQILTMVTLSGINTHRDLLFDADTTGDAQIIIVARLNEFLDSRLVNINVAP